MITNVELTNFKCFEKESFDLYPLTLLTGINGMGKSSLIQSLLLLKQNYENGYLQNQDRLKLDNNSYIDLENCEELCYRKAAEQNVCVDFTNKKGVKYKWIIDASIPDEKDPLFKFEGNESYNEEPLFSGDFIYLNAERLGPRKSYSLFSQNRNYNTKLGIQGELTPAYIQQAATKNQEIYIEDYIHPTIKEKVSISDIEKKSFYLNMNAWLTDILGRRISADIDTIDKDNVKLSFTLRGSASGKFSAMQVGFGFSFSLPVIVAILGAKSGDLLIIENPEAHLHPSAQAKIGELLAIAANAGVQVIVETHSDHILNGIRLSVKKKLISSDAVKIFFWGDEENGSKKEPRIDINGRITEWPSKFFDTWENTLMDLL
ncbi:AAA family ATPase [Flavobacterium panici]|uniref:DUF3696 domain-containing protein n=1 Tax=Flavobacterium panici TaxID=2654843 RepID=A0A9N8J1Q8_9FLAO|nr:DUF3696 domain-containing protein [Flavobacterium panici]CAC9973828.1 hypothetical protein FLAPXU55_01517 [Flavobacterium panici]